MANKSVLYSIFDDLVEAVSPIVGKKYVFLGNRPKITDGEKPMSKFIVVSLPVSIDDYVAGNKKTLLNTTGVFYLFTQARSNNTLDIGATGDLEKDVEDLFPIKGKCITASKPKVRITGSDGSGYQVVTVTFEIQSKWKVFSK